MRRFKMEICYDGSSYSGWQIQRKQPQVRTIQEELENAIAPIVGESVSVLGSGRTDAGVHALYQVASFVSTTRLSPEILTRAINANLPPQIRVWQTEEVPLTFHPIGDILRKRYRYLLSDSRPFFPFWRPYVWRVLQALDVKAMQQAAASLLGTHDFTSFETLGSPRQTSVRTIFDLTVQRVEPGFPWAIPKQSVTNLSSPTQKTSQFSETSQSSSQTEPSGSLSSQSQSLPLSGSSQSTRRCFSPFPSPSLIAVEIEADGFLYNMVRAIVGTLALFGQKHKGFENPAQMKTICDARDRSLAGPTAPPHGLYMIDVIYPSDAQTDSAPAD